MQVDPLSYGEEKHRGFRKTYKRIQPLVRILLHNPNLKPYIFPFLQQIDDWGELFIPDELSEAVNSRKNLSKILNKSYVKSYSKTLEETLEILETFEPLGSTKEEDEFLRLLGKMDTDQFLWWERCIALQIIFAWNEESRLPNLMKKPYKIAHGDLPVYGSNEDALYNAIITLRKSRKQRSSFFIEPNIYASLQLYTNREGQEFIGVGEFWKSGKKLSKIHEKDKQQDISVEPH